MVTKLKQEQQKDMNGEGDLQGCKEDGGGYRDGCDQNVLYARIKLSNNKLMKVNVCFIYFKIFNVKLI